MHSWVERVYERSPVHLQNAMLSAYGWKIARLRYGADFDQQLEELLTTQYLSAAELSALQESALRALIRHCYSNVPYYERLMRDLKLTPDDFRTVADLGKLPLLDKETVRRSSTLFLARNYRHAECEVIGTSGTTGTTLRLRVDGRGRRRNYAFFARLKHWAGVPPGARLATFAGRTLVPVSATSPPFWRHNLAANTLLFSSYHLADHNIPAYLERLRAWNPALIDSYPSSLSILADYALRHGLTAARPKAVITSSETLNASERQSITAAFNTHVFDQYGSAEQVSFISQCEHGSYHIHPEYGITEFMPTPEVDGNAAAIVATGFTNYAMPLLRYQTGDLAAPAAESCVCGRAFPRVECLLGRMDDMIVTPEGRRVGRLDPIFKGLTSVRQAQIVQERVRRLVVKLVPGATFRPADQDGIRHELEKRVGRGMEIAFELVDEIPVGRGGKFRAVVSHVSRSHTVSALS